MNYINKSLKNKLILTAILLLCLFMDIPLSKAAKKPGNEVLSPENESDTVITLVHSRDYKPLFYVDQGGESKGVLVDYWKLWSEKTGVPIRFEAMLWHECIERAREDKNVIVPGIFYTPERDAFLDFSQNFIDIKTSLFAHKSLAINNLKDLSGKSVAVTQGDRVGSFLLKYIPIPRLEVYEGFESIVNNAAQGNIDIFAMDQLCAQYYLHEYDSFDDFSEIKSLYVGKFCAAVMEGNSDLLFMINEGIEQIQREEIDNILEKWLSRSGLAQKWIVNLLLLIAGLIIAITVISSLVFLKIQVRNRTSQLKASNIDLRESEEKYRNLVERANDGIAVIQDGQIKFANQHLTKMLGYTIDEIRGQSFMQFIHPEELPKVNKFYTLRMSGGNVPSRYETILQHRDGSYRDIELNAGIISYIGKDADFVFIRDISEKKRIEEERAKIEEQMQRAQKMEAVGALAGGVAHDLNNILSGIVSYPDLLLMQIDENSPLRKPVETIKMTGLKAAAIVQDLLTLGRRGITTVEPASLNSIISDYLKSPEFVKLKRYHPDVKIETHLDKDLFNINGSPFHLSKAIMNLVSNAAEAMPQGGSVTISTKNIYLDRPITGYDDIEEGDYAVFIISDTGTGLSPEDRERIFEPFYSKKVIGRSGTGLGMAVVWGTVKDHNGYIDVHSTMGKGTTFKIYFQATRNRISETASQFSIEAYMGTGETILVVDDVKEQRVIARTLLKELNYSVTTVSSGEEAVQYLKHNSTDLILLDMIMYPGIDGLETYKKVLELYPGQKAIITSGFSETERVKEAQELGARQYIKKPYTIETIGRAIKEELDR